MRLRDLMIVLGPVAIRDLLVGGAGLMVGGVAFIAGCAYVGVPTMLWFAIVNTMGALGRAHPVLRCVRRPALPAVRERERRAWEAVA